MNDTCMHKRPQIFTHTQCRTTTNHVKDVPQNVTTAKRSCPVGDWYAVFFTGKNGCMRLWNRTV